MTKQLFFCLEILFFFPLPFAQPKTIFSNKITSLCFSLQAILSTHKKIVKLVKLMVPKQSKNQVIKCRRMYPTLVKVNALKLYFFLNSVYVIKLTKSKNSLYHYFMHGFVLIVLSFR